MIRRKAIDAARAFNRTVWTGRRRRRWLFWTQFEYEGPVWAGRGCTPFNADRWPRSRWWSYQAPLPF